MHLFAIAISNRLRRAFCRAAGVETARRFFKRCFRGLAVSARPTSVCDGTMCGANFCDVNITMSIRLVIYASQQLLHIFFLTVRQRSYANDLLKRLMVRVQSELCICAHCSSVVAGNTLPFWHVSLPHDNRPQNVFDAAVQQVSANCCMVI